jgi:hypothetical protein
MARPRSSTGNHQQASAVAAAAALQRHNSGSAGSKPSPASTIPGTAGNSAGTGNRQRLGSTSQVASGYVGRKDTVTWAAAVRRVRKTWPSFGEQHEAQLAKVRISTRPNGELQNRHASCT